MTVKNHRYTKINGVNPLLYLLINKINGHIEESNGNEHLTLLLTDESKYILEKYNELWTKMKLKRKNVTATKTQF